MPCLHIGGGCSANNSMFGSRWALIFSTFLFLDEKKQKSRPTFLAGKTTPSKVACGYHFAIV